MRAIITRLTKANGGHYNRQDVTADLMEDDCTVEETCDYLLNEYQYEDDEGQPRIGLSRVEGWSGWGDVFEVIEDDVYLAVSPDQE